MMVTAGKIFRLASAISLPEIELKLRNYRDRQVYEEGEYRTELVTEIANLALRDGELVGLYSSDFIDHVFHRGKVVPIPKTLEAMFSFATFKDRIYLTVVEKKERANRIANQFSEFLFGSAGSVVEVMIPAENLREFHQRNPQGTRISFFDNVDVPNVEKMSLYGPDIIGTSLFDDYCKHGDLWYIVIESKKKGYVVGITRKGCVTVFSKVIIDDYLSYVKGEIFPLIAQ